MEFTKEQFEEIGPWHFDDLCFDSTDQGFMRKIFNLLPSHLQGMAVSWDCDDSVFRDDVFVYLVKNQFDMTVEEYIASDIYNWYMKKDHSPEFDFDKLKPTQYVVDVETGGFDGKGMISIGEIDPSTGEIKEGELGIIFAPPYVNSGKTGIGATLDDMIKTANEQIDKKNSLTEGERITNTKPKAKTSKPDIGWMGTNPNLKPDKDA